MAKHLIIIDDLTADEITALGVANTAKPCAQYRSTDTEEVWFGGNGGGLIGPVSSIAVPKFYGDHPDDETARANNVPVGGIYFLTFNNSYGMPEGLPKKLTEQP